MVIHLRLPASQDMLTFSKSFHYYPPPATYLGYPTKLRFVRVVVFLIIITFVICIICQFAALIPLVASPTIHSRDVLEPQPGYYYWRKPYVPGSGCSRPVSSGSFRFPP